MRIFDTFSKRQKKREQAGQLDVYQYDNLPEPFRVQVFHIWNFVNESMNPPFSDSEGMWEHIESILARELGLFSLADHPDPYAKCIRHLIKADTNGALDLIDLAFKMINEYVRDNVNPEIANEAIDELNHRFREHNIGYQFSGGELIRVDSQYIHTEVVKPAITLLQSANFRGASEEFLRAHEHYRHGRPKEAIIEALKAFESTMKSICDARKWSYPEGATAKTLIDIMFDKGLIPSAMATHFGGLRSTLQAGLPTIRNKTSGHGQGRDPVVVPEHFAAYALHLAATNIVFLVEAHKAMK